MRSDIVNHKEKCKHENCELDFVWGKVRTSPTRWTWVWVNSGSWWWTGRPAVLQLMGSQRVGHDWVTELRTVAWETASQITLRSCSEKVRGKKDDHIFYFSEGGYVKYTFWEVTALHKKVAASREEQIISVYDFRAFLDMRRCKNLSS